MLEASSLLLEDERKENSSLSSHNVSRCSSPSISHFDGTPLFLLPNAQPTSRRHNSSTTSDMAIKPNALLTNGHTKHEASTKAVSNPKASTKTSTSPPEHQIQVPLQGDHIQESVSRSVPSLSGLSQLLRQEKYQSERGRHVRAQLYRTQLAIARTSRMLTIARSAQQTLGECIRSEDKQSFANLHNVFQEAVANCVEPPHEILEQSWEHSESLAGYPSSFVDALPSSQRTAFLNFLSKLRDRSTFVADRLSSLTHSELLALLPERATYKSSESVFESSVRSASRASRHLGYVVDGQTELLTSYEPSSPLVALISSTRSLSQELKHDPAATEIWATACERLISDHIRGGEKIVPAVIDFWASSLPWPGQQRLDNWIGETLQAGAFILNQPSKQSFRVRVNGRPDPSSDDDGKAEIFFSKAVQSLLELLADPTGVSAIPDGAILLCRNICDRMRLSFGQLDAFCNFVLTRWLFNSFVVDAITLPETHAMATARFISDNARQRILREVVIRTQKEVFGVLYPWKNASPVSSESTTLVHEIARRFRVLERSSPHASRDSAYTNESPNALPARSGLAALSMMDAIALINALYPQRRPASLVSDSEIVRSGAQSSASSVSGFSLFPSPNSSNTTLVYPSNWPIDPVKPELEQQTTQLDSEEVFSDRIGMPSQDEVEVSLLRDVRASIEDTVVSGRFRADRQLALLCFNDHEGTFRTQFSRLRSAGPDENSRRRLHVQEATSSGDPALLREVLAELLEDFPQYWSSAFLPSPPEQDIGTWVLRTLEGRVDDARDHSSFVAAHLYNSKLTQCEKILSSQHSDTVLDSALVQMEEDATLSLTRTSTSIEQCEMQLQSITPALQTQRKRLEEHLCQFNRLRDKMVYIADVRTSAAYDEARSIAAALNVMGNPRKVSKARAAPPLRHWSTPKISNNNLHLKTEAQILEILSASANQGGPNKLSDDQSKALATWLASNDVQNLCLGEERLQKLCMEIRKAIDTLTAEGSPLWTSTLFSRDRPGVIASQGAGASNAFSWPANASRFDMLRLHTQISASRDGLSSTASSHPLSAQSSRDFLDTRSPTLTSKASAPIWSPTMTDAVSPSSATSVGSSHPHSGFGKDYAEKVNWLKRHDEAQADVRKRITSLLLSELTATMFNEGSETDQAFWTGLGGDLAEKHFRALSRVSEDLNDASSADRYKFNFQDAFETLIRQFTTSCDPAAKLRVLVEIDTLLGLSQQEEGGRLSSYSEAETSTSETTKYQPGMAISDFKVSGFRELFCKKQTRPHAIFRDLQYIASLVPSIQTEYSAKSRAFLHASLAIIRLKKELCNIMVETADSIIAHNSNIRGHGRSLSSSAAQQQRDSAVFPTNSQTPPAEDVAKYTMADAAYLLQITAKEGDAVAQRELATLYLTDPELMDHIIAPLARPKEVFKEELESKWRKNQDPNRCDPVTMCVAHHWMSLSAKGGDALAREFLKQREEMERLP